MEYRKEFQTIGILYRVAGGCSPSGPTPPTDGQRLIWFWTLTRPGPKGRGLIADLFLMAGLPVPLKLILPAGMDLTEYMKEGRVGVFLAYVTGVYDTLSFAFRTPDGMTVGQICAVVSKYLKNHPEMWRESADLLVVEALREAFPLNKLSNNKESQIIKQIDRKDVL